MRLPVQSANIVYGNQTFTAYLLSGGRSPANRGVWPQGDLGSCQCSLGGQPTVDNCAPEARPNCLSGGQGRCWCRPADPGAPPSCECAGGAVIGNHCAQGTVPSCQNGQCACVTPTPPCVCALGVPFLNHCAQGTWPYCVGGETGCACLPIPPPCGRWDGTAPFCDGECHCGPGEYCETSPTGDGETCLTGHKARCCPIGGGRGSCSASGSIFNCVVTADHCNDGFHARASTFLDGCHCYCNAPNEGSGSCLNEQQALKACGDGDYEDGGWGCQQGIKLFCRTYPEKCC